MKRVLLTTCFLALILTPGIVAARGKGGGAAPGRGQEKHAEHGNPGKGHRAEQAVPDGGRAAISLQDRRAVIQQYYDRVYLQQGHCPPGLAKKGNGCLPPGQAGRVWQRNKPLPVDVTPQPLPKDLLRKLGPPPPGHAYGYVNGDILLYSTVGKVVVDSISSMF